MASIHDIANEFIREEIEEFLEEPDEIARTVEMFAQATPAMQDIAAALIDGDHHTVDELTETALEEGTEALEIMDDGLIAGMGIVGIKFRGKLHLCARSLGVRPGNEGRNGVYRTDFSRSQVLNRSGQ